MSDEMTNAWRELRAIRGAGGRRLEVEPLPNSHWYAADGLMAASLRYRGVYEDTAMAPALVLKWARRLVAEFDRLEVLGELEADHCPLPLVRKRCRGYDECVCQAPKGTYPAWTDHGRRLRTPHGGVFIAQPYGTPDLERLLSWAPTAGAHVEMTRERSWWYPGRTTLIIVQSARAAAARGVA